MVIVIGLAITHLDPVAEHKVLHFISPPPNGVRWLVTCVYVLGSFGLIVILGTVVLVTPSRRLRDLVVAGLAAVGLLALMWLLFGMSGGRPNDARLSGYNLDYPVVIVAAAVAVTMAALPYLSRNVQRLVELVIGLAAVATVVAGDGLPVNVAASVALGWGTVALLHLVLGSPLGLPSGPELAVVLGDLGVPVSTLSPATHQVWGVALTAAPTSTVGPSRSLCTDVTPRTPSSSPRPAASSSIGTRARLSRFRGSSRSSTRHT